MTVQIPLTPPLPGENRGVFSASEPKLELGVPMPVSGGSTYTQYRVLVWEANGAAADFPLKELRDVRKPLPFWLRARCRRQFFFHII